MPCDMFMPIINEPATVGPAAPNPNRWDGEEGAIIMQQPTTQRVEASFVQCEGGRGRDNLFLGHPPHLSGQR